MSAPDRPVAIGYARCSDHLWARRRAAFERAGCVLVRRDPPAAAAQPVLAAVLALLQPGEWLVLDDLSSLGDHPREVQGALETLRLRQAVLWDLSRPGPFTEAELAALTGEQELKLKHRARRSGQDMDFIVKLAERGWGATAIARETGYSRMTIYRALRRAGAESKPVEALATAR